MDRSCAGVRVCVAIYLSRSTLYILRLRLRLQLQLQLHLTATATSTSTSIYSVYCMQPATACHSTSDGVDSVAGGEATGLLPNSLPASRSLPITYCSASFAFTELFANLLIPKLASTPRSFNIIHCPSMHHRRTTPVHGFVHSNRVRSVQASSPCPEQ